MDMGLLDKFGEAIKKAEDDIRKNAGGGQGPGQEGVSGTARKPHPGYAKIAAWVKTKYKDRIAGTSEFQRGLQLEQLSAEASKGLSAKARKGFLEYLKKQNYEQLLK